MTMPRSFGVLPPYAVLFISPDVCEVMSWHDTKEDAIAARDREESDFYQVVEIKYADQ